MSVRGIYSRTDQILSRRIGPTNCGRTGHRRSGIIRGDLSHDTYEQADNDKRAVHNLFHASANSDDARREIQLWFAESIEQQL